MSSNFIPMLSSSPPPIDDNDSPENDDDDDAFGMFTSANLDFDGSFDSSIPGDTLHLETIDSPVKSTDKFIKSDNQINYSPESGDIPIFPIDKDTIPNIELAHNDILRSETVKGQETKIINCSFTNDESSNKVCLNNFSSTDHHNDLSQKECECTSSQNHLSSSMCNKILPVGRDNELASELSNLEHVSSPKTHIPEEILDLNYSDFNKCLNDKDHSCDSSNFMDVNISKHVNNYSANSEAAEVISNVSIEHVSDSEINNACSTGHISDSESNNIYSTKYASNMEINDVCSAEHISDSEINTVCSAEVHNDCTTTNDISYSEKTSNLHIVNNKQESLARTDPPDKCILLSDRPNDEEFEDFQYATVDDVISENIPFSNEKWNSVDPSEHFDCDEFGDFESIIMPSDDTSTEKQDEVHDASTDNFANFGNLETENNSSWEVAEDDFQSAEVEEFADFEEAISKLECQVTPGLTTISKESARNEDKISKLINAVFPIPESEELYEASEDSLDILDQSNKSRRLWDKLHDVNKTPGIPFQWGVSHSFQQLLRSVNIDYHSILRTSTVPFFASGLGLLEPTKGPGSQPTNDTNTSSSNNDPKNLKDPIPPVHFDWGSSGLINPLDSNQDISALMDLTFLASAERTSSRKTSETFSLENELLRPDLDDCHTASTTKAPILEQILSMSANTSTISVDSASGSRPPNLSQEAVHVLDQLPDISFIRAKVLMFPVSSNT